MDISYIEHQRPRVSGPGWRPFGDWGSSDHHFDPQWWSQRDFLASSRLLSFDTEDAEIARVEIDRDTRYIPGVGTAREIHFLEVNSSFRGQGIGSRVVEQLVVDLHDARLYASTETSVIWWSSRPGWERVNSEDLRGAWVAFASTALASIPSLNSRS